MSIKLYILGKDKDDKGTQLEELTTIILKNQGYKNISTNDIYGGGSEIDVVANHKQVLGITEINHTVICECKAHNSPISLTDWLKFIGKLHVAKLKDNNTCGLMIALSGVNGNVLGAYNELKSLCPHEIHLITNDDLIELLRNEYSLCDIKDVDKSVAGKTHRHVSGIDLIYHSKGIYWIIQFSDNSYTLLNPNLSIIDEAIINNLIPLVNTNTPFLSYIDILAEYNAIMRNMYIDKFALSILMENSNPLTANEILSLIPKKENKFCKEPPTIDELIPVLNSDPFIKDDNGKYSLCPISTDNKIDFCRYVLSPILPIRLLSQTFYLDLIDDEMLKLICQVQHGINIPQNKKKECLFMLKYSPSALLYAITEGPAITSYRNGNGTTLDDRIDAGHTQWFIHHVINSFVKDIENSDLSELYFENYKITDITINHGLSITKDDKQVKINDKTDLSFARLSWGDFNPVVLVAKLPVVKTGKKENADK